MDQVKIKRKTINKHFEVHHGKNKIVTSSGAANSSLALVLRCSVTLLMARRELFFLSPTTTHHASVLSLGYRGAHTCNEGGGGVQEGEDIRYLEKRRDGEHCHQKQTHKQTNEPITKKPRNA